MGDEDLRALQRRWQETGTREDEARFCRELERVGTPRDLDVVILGHVSHGKTTLAAAMREVLGVEHPPFPFSCSLRTDRRSYTVSDLRSFGDVRQDLIEPVDAVVLAVSAVDGPMPQTHVHLACAAVAGVRSVIVALTRMDEADPELLPVVEEEVREVLQRHGFPAAFPICRVAALPAVQGDAEAQEGVRTFLQAMDDHCFPVHRDPALPFLMSVEGVYALPKGTVATGKITRGIIRPADVVELLGLVEGTRQTRCLSIEHYREEIPEARAGLNVGIFLEGLRRDDLWRGQTLAFPGSIRAHSGFNAQVTWLRHIEGGRARPITEGFAARFHFRSTTLEGRIRLPEEVELCMPGDSLELTVELDSPLALEEQQRFTFTEGSRTIGLGQIRQLHD